MHTRFKTVKSRIILLMISFATIVTLLIAVFSFYLLYIFQRRTVVQSAEFNLQLVASVIEQDIRDLTALGYWCGTSSQITDYFAADTNEKYLALQAYDRMREEFRNNRASRYIRRLLVVDSKADKILQVGNFAGSSDPVTIYTLGRLEGIELGTHSEWAAIISDPFYFSPEPGVIPLLTPVYASSDRSHVGTVFLAASTTVITDKLNGYSLPEGSSLYLTLGEHTYLIQIQDNSFISSEPIEASIIQNTGDAISSESSVSVVLIDGERRTIVSYPVRKGIVLTQVLSNHQFMPQRSAWVSLLVILCLLILSLALLITYNLDRHISRPVARLRKKIDAIAEGDFSADPGLESDNELGQMGKGVNKLSREVVTLMESRIADEKNKRELEYRMLQSQINPHFVYNTLNSIKWMATLQNAVGIAEMTTSLSRLLKTVSKDIRKVAPLKEELALLDDYIVIQQYRYGGDIAMTRQIEDPALLNALIPRFSLQPLVENAIFHGIEPKGAGSICLTVSQDRGDVLVSITDDGVGIDSETLKKIYEYDISGMVGKMGVHNVNERLRYAFGEGYGLSIKSEAGHYTTMTIRLPFTEPAKEGAD